MFRKIMNDPAHRFLGGLAKEAFSRMALPSLLGLVIGGGSVYLMTVKSGTAAMLEEALTVRCSAAGQQAREKVWGDAILQSGEHAAVIVCADDPAREAVLLAKEDSQAGQQLRDYARHLQKGTFGADQEE